MSVVTEIRTPPSDSGKVGIQPRTGLGAIPPRPTISATLALVEVVCPVCAKRNVRRVLVRAMKDSTVEAYCRDCKFRKIVTI